MKKKFADLEFFSPIINWIAFLMLASIALILFLYSQLAEFEDPNFKIIFLLMFAIFSYFAFMREKFGVEYLPQYYKFLGMKSKRLIVFLTLLPLFSYGIYFVVALSTTGKVFLYWLVNVSLLSFFCPMILVLLILVGESLQKILIKNKKRGVRND